MNNRKRFSSINWIKWGLIPALLFAIWAIGFLFEAVEIDQSFAVISQSYNKSNFTKYQTKEIHSGESVSGSFTAKYNYLGIVLLRFNNFQRINNDIVHFRIREDGSDSWFYEGDYTSGQFQPHGLFTFGFPIINDSAGKTYFFEVESLKGKRGDAISISSIEPVLVTKYQFPKSIITKNPVEALGFLINKLQGLLTNTIFLTSSLIYALPFLYYMLWNLVHKKTKSKLLILSFFPIIFIFLDIFFINLLLPITDLIIIIISLSWIMSILTHKLESSVSYSLAIFFLIICMLFVIFDKNELAEKAAIWVYMMLLIGAAHNFIEYKTKHSNKNDYRHIFTQLVNYKNSKNV